MTTAHHVSITLPPDMAEAVAGKVRAGHYASVSDMVCDGLRALLAHDAAVERWLREDVLPGHQDYVTDPAKGVPAGAILGRIKARRGTHRQP